MALEINIPVATATDVGVMKPDGVTTQVAPDGTLSAIGGGSGGGGVSPQLRLYYEDAGETVAYEKPIPAGGTSSATAGWTDLTADQAFTLASGASRVEIRAVGSVILGPNGAGIFCRALIDGTHAVLLGAGRSDGGAAYGQCLPGAAPFVDNPGAGAHTIKLQVFAQNACFAYCDPVTYPGTHFLTLQVIEWA